MTDWHLHNRTDSNTLSGVGLKVNTINTIHPALGATGQTGMEFLNYGLDGYKINTLPFREWIAKPQPTEHC